VPRPKGHEDGRIGRPPNRPDVASRQPPWLVDQKNYQLLLHWLALRVPGRLVLQYCEESGIKVPGTMLGEQLQSLANFTQNHRQEIVLLHDEIRAMAMGDAQKRRQDFLEQQYAVRDWLYEHMPTDRDQAGRTHMVRDYIHLSNSIAELEGFKKGTFDPRQDKALKMLTDYMFGDKNAASTVDAEVTVLESRQLTGGSDASEHSGSE